MRKRCPPLLSQAPPAGQGADPFTRCNILESGLCTISGHHSGPDPVDEDTGESILRTLAWETWPHPSSTTWRHEQGRDALPPPLPINARGRWENGYKIWGTPSPIRCSAWKSGACTLPGHHNRANVVGGDAGGVGRVGELSPYSSVMQW